MAWLQQRVRRWSAYRRVAICSDLLADVLTMLVEHRRKLWDDDTGELEVDGESARPPVKERCRYLIEILIISL